MADENDSFDPAKLTADEKQRLLTISSSSPTITIRTVHGAWYKDEEPDMEEAFYGMPLLLLTTFSKAASKPGNSIVPVWNILEDISTEAVRTLCEWMMRCCKSFSTSSEDYDIDTNDLTVPQYLRLWLAATLLGIETAEDSLDDQANDVMSRADIYDVVRGFHFLRKYGLERSQSDASQSLRRRLQALVSGEALGRILDLKEVEFLFHAADFTFPSSKHKAVILAANQIWEDEYSARHSRISGLRKPLRKRFEGVWKQFGVGSDGASSGGVVVSKRNKGKAQVAADHRKMLKQLLERC